MLQTLDVITVNLWHILISIANLLILFFVVKRFLFKPVKELFARRQAELDRQYAAAAEAEAKAEADQAAWAEKLQGARDQADAIINDATAIAKTRAEGILADADEKAEGIVKRAEEEAILTRKKATEGIKREIVEVSTALAEKMLEREISVEDHRDLIDAFIDTVGDGDE